MSKFIMSLKESIHVAQNGDVNIISHRKLKVIRYRNARQIFGPTSAKRLHRENDSVLRL